MNKEFIESIGSIRQESIGMLKNVRAVKGENYARVVHSIILADQIDMISGAFVAGADEESKELAEQISGVQLKMLALIMQYFIRSTGFSEEQIEEAFRDAEQIQKNTNSLVSQAKDMADNGQVMGR